MMRGGIKYNGIIYALLLMFFFCDDIVQGKPLSFIGTGTYQHTEDEGSESQVSQSTTLELDQPLTPVMSIDETVRYTTTFKGGYETEAITPSLDYQINNDLFYFDLSGTWNKLRNSERSDLTSSNWQGRWISNWQKELWPMVQLNYAASSTIDDESPSRIDAESTFSGFNIDWDLLLAKVYYNIDLNESDDFVANSNDKSTNQLARLTTEKSFWEDRLNVTFLGQYANNTQDFETKIDPGGSALVPIHSIESRGGQASPDPDDDPEWNELTSFPNTVIHHERYNVAIFQLSPQPVNDFYIYTETDLGETESGNLNRFQWTVYTSSNGTEWSSQGPATSQIYDSTQQRFEIEIPQVTAKFVMLVEDRIPTDDNFNITRVEAFTRVSGDPGQKITHNTTYYTYLGDTSLRFLITPDLNWTYNLIMEDGETAVGDDISRTYNSTSLIWSPTLSFSSTMSASESKDQVGDEDEEKTRYYSLSFSSLLLPTVDMNYGVTRSDIYEADVKTDTSYNYNMFLTALIFPDLTSNLDLAYITERDEETDETSKDFNSTLKFTARLNPEMTVDLTERYNTSNAEESTWTASSLIGISWRASDILSMQVGAGQEWESDESSAFTNYLTVTVAPTYKTQLNLSYNHSESSDDYSANYNWTINRIFSMHAYCTYIDEDETEFAYGGQFVIRY
ncbi:MAG: hypothetical protein KKC76_12710 [Proteobacteria bacterium]|nr:hypothetical protein [Pseudomonadota bacterium]MBU4295026.1 hypothetical protein [Pseudomonadota bacterium]MCG2746622.1 hypothetical protein [Desulfobulbaceae bacterium]